MTRAKVLSTKFFNPIEAYLAVGVLYVVLVAIMTLIMRYVEIKTIIPGLDFDYKSRQ